MVALPSRSARRYQANLPIELKVGNRTGTFCTNLISASGCVVCGEPPDWVADVCAVRLPLPRQKTLELPVVRATRSERGDLHLAWELSADQAAMLTRLLRSIEVEPSADAKTHFLTRENELIHSEILHLDVERRRGNQFLMVLVAAYFAFTIAPYRVFESISVEMLAVYAIAGMWASVMSLLHCTRFLDFLGLSVRKRAHLYKALAGNRGWVFAHDPAYHAKGLMPLGSRYDDALAWRTSFSDNRERFAQWIKYQKSTIGHMVLLQSLFVAGCLYFASMAMRAYDLGISGGSVMVPTPKGGPLDLFDRQEFGLALAAFCLVPLGWMHLLGNKVLSFQKRVWEARRISSIRPNPRFLDGAFKDQQVELYKLFHAAPWALLIYGIVALPLASSLVRARVPGLASFVYHPISLALVAAALVIIKVVYIRATLRAASKADRDSQPIRAIGPDLELQSGS
jgi:hypothetical protein